MKYFKRMLPLLVVAGAWLPAIETSAQEFADDFSSDSITFSGGTFSDSSGVYSFTPAGDGMGVSISNDSTNTVGSAYLQLNDTGDTLGMDFTHLSSSDIQSGYVTAFLEAFVYSDNEDYLNTNEGTVEAEITVGYNSQNQLVAYHCLLRIGADDQISEVPDTCGEFEGLNLQFDESNSYDIALDRQAGTITLSVNDVAKVFTVAENIYPPHDTFKRFQLYHNDGTGTANASVQAFRLDGKTIDVAENPPVVNRYDARFDPGAMVQLEDGAMSVAVVSDENDDRWENAELQIQESGDYLEAELMLSSESVVSATSNRAFAGIESIVYNAIANGGTDGRTGDVRAGVYLEARGDGLRRIEVCLQKLDDADGNNRSGLLDDGDRCRNLPVLLEFDKPYRVSMALDRDASTFTFRVNGFIETASLSSGFFEAAEPYSWVAISALAGGTAVGTIDNIRTAPDALTATEQASGLTTPEPFPELVDPASLVAESSLRNPLGDIVRVGYEMNFIDDFSTRSTTDFAFWGREPEYGESGLYYDGEALVIEASSINEDGNNGELIVHDTSDFLEAEISLSSLTAIPAGDSRARARIAFTVFNDTVDGGSDQAGDMSFDFGIEKRGDGRVQVSYYGERRGDDSGLGLDDIEQFQNFRTEPLALDTVYRFRLELDRENRVVRFRIDDLVAEYPIAGNLFEPNRYQLMVKAQHGAASGRSVVKLHTLETENLSYDFSAGVPAIGPYRPHWNAQSADRDVVWDNGRVKLIAEGGGADGWRPARVVARSKATYVSADLAISGESSVEQGGRIHAHVGSNLYNSLADGGFEENSNGQVYGSIEIHVTDSERYAALCAWRSDGENWTDLIGNDDELCLTRFDLVPELDQSYTASVELDTDNSQIIYRLNDEVKTYSISTGIFETKDYWLQARAVTYDDSVAVVHVDNLTINKNAPPILESDDLLAKDLSPENTSGQNNAQSSSSGGGAMSAGTLILAFLAFLSGFKRRCYARSLMPVTLIAAISGWQLPVYSDYTGK